MYNVIKIKQHESQYSKDLYDNGDM